jgi:hypothetical protein
MKTIVENSLYDTECALSPAEVIENDESEIKEMTRPLLPVLKECWIAASHDPSIRLPVKVLLDTGCDITIVNPTLVDELDDALKKKNTDPSYVHPARKIKFYTGKKMFQKAYELSIILSVDGDYSSQYGFIAPEDWDFEGMDVWLGQDIFAQLIVTFDGVNQTLTIADPARD